MPATLERKAPTSGAMFHFGLNVADLKRSVDFYRLLFDREPLKSYHDYAKFEMTTPPFVMSLLPNPQYRGGTLYHLGLRWPDSATLVEVQTRLEHAGVSTIREEGVECCYALQTKFWVRDPDQNLWEMYVLHEDLDHHGNDLPPGVGSAVPDAAPTVATVWEHRFGQPLPDRIPAGDGVIDDIRFESTWSMDLPAASIERIVAEAYRTLKPGGTVMIHGLVAERDFPNGPPKLEGPVAKLKRIPTETECLTALQRAGFRDLYFKKLGNTPCFAADGVGMREMRLIGTKPADTAVEPAGSAMYLGPFASVKDELGREFRCGVRVSIDASTKKRLKASPLAESFAFVG